MKMYNPALLCLPALLLSSAAASPEQVTVSASKQHNAAPQDMAATLDLFGENEIAARGVETLQDLSFAMPNVQIEDLGTARGIANLSIRGIGVNSSIASVDPAVGVFADGVYLGINAGTLTDLIDTEAIAVLRGPQGTLYGHNVTGGAVLIQSRLPSQDFEWRFRAGIESGPASFGEAVISGPLLPGVLSARLALGGRHDDGWFTNRYDGSAFGKNDSYGARLSMRFTPSANFEAVLRLEHGDETGDGPAGQNHALFARGSFDFSIDDRGYAKTHWDQITLQTDWRSAFGRITNIAAFRQVTVGWAADVDSTPAFAFHTRVLNLQSQRSDELRYAVDFGAIEALAGLYYFDSALTYIDERNFSPSFRRTGGGQGYFQDIAAFANADWHASGALTFSAGLRFTHERKHSRISRVRRASDDLDGATVVPGEGVAGGDLDARVLNFSDTPFFQAWDDFSPRFGVQWRPDAATNIYASWSRAFRGGGANFRTSSLGLAPRAYNPETVSSFELGWKQAFESGGVNLALFHTSVGNMQRETNLADPVSGVQQVVLNAGNARLYGGEIEAQWSPVTALTLSASLGYVHGQYSRVTADLNGDLVVDAADQHMRIPRLAPLSASAAITYTHLVAGGVADAGLSFGHRDASYYNDSNLGRLAGADVLDAHLAYAPEGQVWRLNLYGKNLTNVATWGGDTTLPASAAFGYSGAALPTFSPLNKGRVIGVTIAARLK
jgi:iron complex outermembrane recepter protein